MLLAWLWCSIIHVGPIYDFNLVIDMNSLFVSTLVVFEILHRVLVFSFPRQIIFPLGGTRLKYLLSVLVIVSIKHGKTSVWRKIFYLEKQK